MKDVARQLGLRCRTLGRRFSTEECTFEAVLDDLRRNLAIDYISARKVSVNETAYLTGYADPVVFSRAFKRWTGKSLSELRRLSLTQQS